MWTLFAIFRILRSVRPDAFLAYTIKPVVYGLIAARVAGVPKRFALITGLGYTFAEERNGRLVGLIARRLYSVALAGATKVFFQNPDDERLFRSLKILHPEVPSIVLNGSGIDVQEFQIHEPPTELSFLLIARLIGGKGVREYAEAAREVRKSHPRIRFKLVGWIDEGNPDAIRQDELDEWVNDRAIEFIGRLADVRPAIAESSVYVLPSKYREGTPRTVLEALAMGRPVITTNTPGCKETVVEGENGFLIPPGSSDALVEAMLKFACNPELVARMGRRSREIAENKYDVRTVNSIMLKEMSIDIAQP